MTAEPQRVMLWNPWQADVNFYHGKPVDVPAGWRVLGMADKDIILVSVDEDAPKPESLTPPKRHPDIIG